MPRAESGAMTVYPGAVLKREIAAIAADDHDRPQAKVVELAIKAFIVAWRKDRWGALKQAAEYDQQGKGAR